MRTHTRSAVAAFEGGLPLWPAATFMTFVAALVTAGQAGAGPWRFFYLSGADLLASGCLSTPLVLQARAVQPLTR